MSQTIFVLEDDVDISRLVQHHLEAAGYEVRLFHTPTNLIPDAERKAPALFLLDIMVPGGDGLDVCRRLRSHHGLSTVPIIFVTARAGENDRVLGLELGADDYLTKPFSFPELLARIASAARRTRFADAGHFSFGPFRLDVSKHRLFCGHAEIHITRGEYLLLRALALHRGEVVSRRKLMQAVWGATAISHGALDTLVNTLREKLNAEKYGLIATVRGIGYSLVDDLKAAQ